jgi:hypothetical protein
MRKSRLFSIGVVLLILFVNSQHATADENLKPEEIMKIINNNISHEYTTCAAYFTIVSEGLRRSSKYKEAEMYNKHRDMALQYALISASTGRSQEMAEKVTASRFELETKSLLAEIDNDISNISVLLNKYGSRCKFAMEDPEKVMEEWKEKILKRYNMKYIKKKSN